MGRASNLPAQRIEQLNGQEYTGVMVDCISDLARQGKPRTLEELNERLNRFFEICSRGNVRPGVETLCCSLGISRQTFWLWCNSKGVPSEDWADACRAARQCVIAFLEQASLSGHISPPAGIFLLKNWASYRDLISFEDVADAEKLEEKKLTRAQMLASMDLPMKSRTAAVDDFEA